MSRNRTPVEKTADWYTVFNAISGELTPTALRTMLSRLTETMGTTGEPSEAIALLQSSMALARLVSANDRAAAIAAAVLTSSGGARPVVVEDQE